MIWFLASVAIRRVATMVVVSLLLSALLMPGAALAEPQKISIKNFAWSGGGTCPEKEGKISFTVLGQWCEVEIKNENAIEAVLVEKEQLKVFTGCILMGGLCISTKVPANKPECEEKKTKLAAGKACFNKLEYAKKPAGIEEVGYRVETKSTPGNVGAAVEAHMLVE
jgi:hypothetical protein